MASMKLDLTRIPLLELYKHLECDANGLTEPEARRRLLELRAQQRARRPAAPMRFAGFLRNPFAIIYAVCAIALVALTRSNWPTFIGMVGLLLGNIALCLVIEQNTLNARRKLRCHPDFSACLVQVKRDGVWTSVVAADLVRGDVILLAGRYLVPTQCRLIVCNRLRGAGYAEKVVGDVCQFGSQITSGDGEAVVITTKDMFTPSPLDNSSAALQMNWISGLFGIACLLLVATVLVTEALVVYTRFHYSYHRGINTLLVLLLDSIPMALPNAIFITLSTAVTNLASSGIFATRLEIVEELARVTHVVLELSALIEPTLAVYEVKTYGPFTADEVRLLARYANSSKPSASATERLGEFFDGGPAGHPDIEILHYRPLSLASIIATYRDRGQCRVKRVAMGLVGHVYEECTRNRTNAQQDQLEQDIEAYALEGMITKALAYEELDEKYDNADATEVNWEEAEGNGLELVGMLAFAPPLRDGSEDAVAQLLSDGVKIKLVSSQWLAITKHIARQVGLDDKIFHPAVFRNEKLGAYPTLDALILDAVGFSVMSSEQKQDLLQHLEHMGHVCAYLGDEFNGLVSLSTVSPTVNTVSRVPGDLLTTHPCLPKYVSAIRLSRQALSRLSDCIIYIGATTLHTILCFPILVFAYKLNFSPFAMLLISVNTNVLVLAMASEKGSIRSKPLRWNPPGIFVWFATYGVYSAISTIILLVVATKTEFFRRLLALQLPEQQNTLVYLQTSQIVNILASLVRFDLQTLKQTPSSWSWQFPAIVCLGLLASSFIAAYADRGFAGLQSVNGAGIGVVWIWNVVFSVPLVLALGLRKRT